MDRSTRRSISVPTGGSPRSSASSSEVLTTKPPKRRPDFVVLPDISIGAYCADAYDAAGEISGIRKVAILELKKGGFCVSQKEVDQARDYTKEIRKAGRVQATTDIVAYVLGATLEPGLEQMTLGDKTNIIPMVYQTVLRKAHQRTFNLQKRLQESQLTVVSDPEVEEVLRVNRQMQLFDDVAPRQHVPCESGTSLPTTPTLHGDGAA